MQRLTVILLLLSVIDHGFSNNCGCTPKKLLKRDFKFYRMGDMLLDESDIALLKGFKTHTPGTKRWPNGEVLYWFDRKFAQDKKAIVKEVLAELEKDLGGCIKFEESTRNHYIEVSSYGPLGCAGSIGHMPGPKQLLNLANPSCLVSKGTIKHEFIHALGFWHTHMRKDRDDFIKINWDRIAPNQCHNFQKCHGCELDGPYETTSVMHYPSTAFACVPGENVIFKKNGDIIDYNHNTTPNDLDMIKRFYQC